jgi:hypothetical protein
LIFSKHFAIKTYGEEQIKFVVWVLTTVWVLIPTFRRNILLPSSGLKRQYVPLKRWYLPLSPHGFTTQKNNIDIFTAVRTSDLIQSRYNSTHTYTWYSGEGGKFSFTLWPLYPPYQLNR